MSTEQPLSWAQRVKTDPSGAAACVLGCGLEIHRKHYTTQPPGALMKGAGGR